MTTHPRLVSLAFIDGSIAASTGKSAEENPHKEGSVEHSAWKRGHGSRKSIHPGSMNIHGKVPSGKGN